MPEIAADEYLPNTVIFKVKSSYRANCSNKSIDGIEKISTLFSAIQVTKLEKIFPNHTAPAETYNNLGQKLEDLSLIYTLYYSSTKNLEKTINQLYSIGIFEYVQPYYLPKSVSFTPNDANIGLQYHIQKMRADSAWGINTTTARGDTNVVIGIIDSGVELTHPDLKNNIKYNYSDPLNMIDDDGDGYVDNYMGWDLGSNDNDPSYQGSDHGVHVSGIAAASTNNTIGVAGIGFTCKFLPIKATNASGFLTGAYQSIVYAADHNCKIINCSWGAPTYSPFGQTVVNYATYNHNALIVAAAGNNGAFMNFYPAALDNVLSVAATNGSDIKWAGSNWSYQVDLCAPGDGIYSTISGNSYSTMSGTSMASPNAAGAAAIVKSFFPSYTSGQIAAQLKATCDNIDALNNPSYKNKLGTGRINLYKALTNTNTKYFSLTTHTETDNNNDIFLTNDTIRITGTFLNYLSPISSLTASLSVISGNNYVALLDSTTTLGALNTLGSAQNTTDPFLLTITNTVPINTSIKLRVSISDGTVTHNDYFEILINADYIDVSINDISTTITSKGLIGFNNINQTEGLGFTYKSSSSLLYESSFMIGTSTLSVSDRARAASGNYDSDFIATTVVKKIPNIISNFDIEGLFNDSGAGANALPVSVRHSAHAWNTAGHTKYIILKYVIKNTGNTPLNNLYAGILADWDIDDLTYTENKAAFDASTNMGYAFHTANQGLYCGIKVVSTSAGANHYALDNNNNGAGGINVSDGFDTAEKYIALSTPRSNAGGSGNGDDIISLVSTGPYSINANDSVIVGFAILAGDSLADLKASAQNAQVNWNQYALSINKSTLPLITIHLFPNPTSSGYFNLEINNDKEEEFQLSISDALGRTLIQTKAHGNRLTKILLPAIEKGIYFVTIKNKNFHEVEKLIIE
ncbi:MAG: S8 family peptidase [Bacteroidetes bacterium]|nr:S8 family peptidase [Bacteroidota bacterium]